MPKEDDNITINIPGLNSIGKFKAGPGVVGKASTVMVGLLVFLGAMGGAIAMGADVIAILIISGLGVVMAGTFFALSFWYANKHPNHAIMDGGEMVRFTEITHGASEENIINVGSQEIVANNAPTLLPKGDEDEA